MELFKQTSQSEIYEKVKIIVRIRPTLKGEDERDFVETVDQQSLNLLRPGNNVLMKFSDILSKSNKQDDVFMLTNESVIHLLNGTNSTIFAYGQTGAGKTYTIIGDNRSSTSFNSVPSGIERGVLIRTLEMVLSELESKKKDFHFKLYISYFEIYNEKIYDLLINNHIRSNSSLEIRESKNFEVQIPDLTNVSVNSMKECLNYLQIGLKNRATGNTFANKYSSRSHSIFQMTLCKYTSNSDPIISTLKLVDLAGSEKFQMEGFSNDSKDLRIQELTSINGSLSCLGQVITALMDKSRKHIPFRDSKLTRVLSDSLSGNSKIYFIICISPSISSSSETISTLQFANRAKKVILDGRNIQIRKNSEMKTSNKEEVSFLKIAYNKEKLLREEYEKLLKESNVLNFKNEFNQLREENEKLKEKIQEIQTTQTKSSNFCHKKSNSILATLEKNRVLQKIKQKELSPNKENKQDVECLESFSLIKNSENKSRNISKDILLEKKIQNQNNLKVSPSGHYLINLKDMENDYYEYSNKSPLIKKSINSTITEKKIMIKDSMGDDFKNEMDQALRHLLFLQEKDKKIKMLIK